MYKYTLDNFIDYLRKKGYAEFTLSGNKSTIYDYAGRIEKVCKNEKMSLEKLSENIDRFCIEYDYNGSKEHLGAISHRAVINALKAFRDFCKS